MNELKVVMLGTAIMAEQEERTTLELKDLLREPPEADDVRYVTGIVAMCMERPPQPDTLRKLRAAVIATELTESQRHLVSSVLFGLLTDEVLEVDIDHSLSYNPPQNESYLNALRIAD